MFKCGKELPWSKELVMQECEGTAVCCTDYILCKSVHGTKDQQGMSESMFV